MTIDFGQGLMNALIFMGPMAVIGTLVCLWWWERTCRTKTKLRIIKQAGGVDVQLVPKDGSDVTLHNPSMGVTRTWPISRLATIRVPYPDVAGLLPRFLQREIDEVTLQEGDWEPVFNRSPHREKIMSPDAINFVRELAHKYGLDETDSHGKVIREAQIPELGAEIDLFLTGVSSGPTREMIGDPSWLGAFKISTTLKALASVSDDLLEALKGIRNQLARFAGLNSTFVYIGLGLIIVLQGFSLYHLIQGSAGGMPPETIQKIDAIYRALGIK